MRALLTVAIALGLTASVGAQGSDLADRQRRLLDARRGAEAAQRRADALRAAADRAQDEAARAAAEERALGARVMAAEAELEAARARVAVVDDLLARQRARLGEARAPVARLLAALQSFARRPAVAAVAQPGSVDDLVHLRAVLGGALPHVEAGTAALRDELARTERLQASAALAARALRDGRARLEADRLALAQAEARHRARAQALGRGAMSEADRALALGEGSRELVERMSAEDRASARASELAQLPGPLPRPVASAAPPVVGGAYRLPVAGRLVTGFDEVSAAGVRSRGLSLAVRPGATVSAPADGTVRYARAYRGYGTVVIVDHGAGWTTTILGLGRAQVAPGTAVQAGAPLGVAPAGDEPQVTVELRRRGRPVDLAALL